MSEFGMTVRQPPWCRGNAGQLENRDRGWYPPITRGTDSSNPAPSSAESVSALHSRALGGELRIFSAVCAGTGTREGTVGCARAPFDRFSLTGVGAVPPRRLAAFQERVQATARPRQARGLCILNLGLAQLPSNLCCSAQSSGR